MRNDDDSESEKTVYEKDSNVNHENEGNEMHVKYENESLKNHNYELKNENEIKRSKNENEDKENSYRDNTHWKDEEGMVIEIDNLHGEYACVYICLHI